jgi:hypothetical protein
MSGGEIQVWRQPDGFWRWRYRNPADGTDLLSNESHATRAGAVRAATLAYPGILEVRVRPGRSGSKGASWLKRLAILALILWIPRKLVRAARRARRLRKVARVLRFFRTPAG